MPKTAINQYSATASNNTDIDNIDTGEGTMVPSDVNNAIRELMAHLADMNLGNEIIDDTFTLADPTDNAKRFRFDGESITTSNTRVMTIPDNNITLAGINLAQEFNSTQNFDATTLANDVATILWDASANQVTSVTLNATTSSLGAPTNQKDGAVYIISIIQDATGNRTISFNANYKFVGGSAPVLTSTANARDVLTFLSNGTNFFEIGRALNVS
tara:strand:+ start:1221 stop:1865 length:645 start_codon:yes stop_codon:yes gene_type:complete